MLKNLHFVPVFLRLCKANRYKANQRKRLWAKAELGKSLSVSGQELHEEFPSKRLIDPATEFQKVPEPIPCLSTIISFWSKQLQKIFARNCWRMARSRKPNHPIQSIFILEIWWSTQKSCRLPRYQENHKRNNADFLRTHEMFDQIGDFNVFKNINLKPRLL